MHAPDSNGLVLVGGGGHALVVAEAAILSNHRVAGFFDDASSATLGLDFQGKSIFARLGSLERAPASLGPSWILALGDLAMRRRFLDRLNSETLARARSVLHPRAIVSSATGLVATIGLGSYVGPGAIVHSRASIGAHAIINSGAVVEHECEIGENAHIAPGAVLGGRVRIGADTLVGLGARVLPGITIGSGCVIGAGAVVIDDTRDGTTIVGVPARTRA